MPDIIKSRKLSLAYSFYTLIFFSVQLRIVIDAVYYENFSVSGLFLSLLLLKLGELVNEIIVAGSTKLYAVIGMIALSVVLFGNGIAYFAGCFIFGLSMMKVRDETINHSSKRIKFIARAIGFILAPVLPYSFLVIIGGAATFIIFFSKFKDRKQLFHLRWYSSGANNSGNWCMGIHHFHYFSYAYSIPLIYQLHTSLNYVWLGLVFYIGWAAYNAYKRFVRPAWGLILAGHVIAGFSLVMLADADTMLSMTFWWFMTGLGGGTIYMIQPLVRHNTQNVTELKISEGFGHVFGILVWGTFCILLGVKATFLTGALGGMVVALIALYKVISLNKIPQGTVP